LSALKLDCIQCYGTTCRYPTACLLFSAEWVVCSIFSTLFQWVSLYKGEWSDGKWTKNSKGCRSRWFWPNWRYYPQYLPGGIEKNH